MKKSETNALEHFVIENNVQAKITLELARQLVGLLPIVSFEEITEKLGEVVVERHRLSTKMFAPHIGNDLFPIEDAEELVRKLSAGVRSALAIGHSASVPIKNPSVRSLLAITRQEDPGKRLGVPIVFGGRGSSQN